MTVKCELLDYEDRDRAYENPRVVVTDAGVDGDMVRLRLGDETVGYKTVKVSGKELIEAATRCMKAQWPY